MTFSPLPGEFIGSAFRRGRELLGHRRGTKGCEYSIKAVLSTVENQNYEIAFPNILVEHGVAEQSLREHTLYPYILALSRRPTSATFTPTQRWRICTVCVQDDIERYGTAFIHSCHLPSLVTHCRIHATALHMECPTCNKRITSHNLSDLRDCSESFLNEHTFFGSLQQEFAIFAHDLFRFRGKPLQTLSFDRTLYDKFVKAVYDDNHALAYDDYLSFIHRYFGLRFNHEFSSENTLNLSSAMAFLTFRTADSFFESMYQMSRLNELPKMDMQPNSFA